MRNVLDDCLPLSYWSLSISIFDLLLFSPLSSLPPSLQLQCSSASAWNVVDNAIPSSRHIMMSSLYNEQDKFLIRRRPSYPLRFVLLLKRYLSSETTWRMIEMMKKVATAAEVDSEGARNNEERKKEREFSQQQFFSSFFCDKVPCLTASKPKPGILSPFLFAWEENVVFEIQETRKGDDNGAAL